MLSDFIVYYKIPDFIKPKKKKPIVIYVSRKANAYFERVTSNFILLDYRPLAQLDRVSFAYFIKKCTNYIDFGINPGKDRIPREVVAYNRNIIIPNIGAARNEIDFPYSFELKLPLELPNKELLEKTDEIIRIMTFRHFTRMQKSIQDEIKVFNIEVNSIFGLENTVKIQLKDKCRLITFDLLELIQLKFSKLNLKIFYNSNLK